MNPGQRISAQPGDFVKYTPKDYEIVAASQTAQAIGARGAAGDIVDCVVITSNTAATATVTLIDGANSIPLLVGSATTPLGVFTISCYGMASVNGGWTVTTGAGATALLIGSFS